jgi:nicotinamidase-related amidase
VLLLIDFQEKLMPTINDNEVLRRNVIKMIAGCQALNIPVLLTEQYPRGLGATIPEIQKALMEYQPIEKTSFSCFGSPEFTELLQKTGRNQVLVCGIESHICVYQTCRELDNNGYYVHLVTDCISSRQFANKELAIRKLSHESNIMIIGYEMALFEILRNAENPQFREISRIIK